MVNVQYPWKLYNWYFSLLSVDLILNLQNSLFLFQISFSKYNSTKHLFALTVWANYFERKRRRKNWKNSKKKSGQQWEYTCTYAFISFQKQITAKTLTITNASTDNSNSGQLIIDHFPNNKTNKVNITVVSSLKKKQLQWSWKACFKP